MQNRTSLLVLLACASPAQAVAQEQAAVEPGTRIQVWADCPTPRTREACTQYVGSLAALSADSLVMILAADSVPHTIGLNEIVRLKANRGQGSAWKRGALFGMLGGALIGGVIGYVSYPEDAPCWWDNPEPCPALTAFAGAAFGALGGALIGGLIGSQAKTERWEEVPVSRLQVSVSAWHDAASVRLSYSF
jgi:hypothetical protein